MPSSQDLRAFNRPNLIERVFSWLFGILVRLGLGLRHNYLLQVRGRKTGRVFSTPVDVLDRDGRQFLVSGRGYSQWVRNALASGEVILKRGSRAEPFAVRMLSEEEKPEILKAYLDRFKLTVQRYFPLPAGSPPEAFRSLAARYPAFELLRKR